MFEDRFWKVKCGGIMGHFFRAKGLIAMQRAGILWDISSRKSDECLGADLEGNSSGESTAVGGEKWSWNSPCFLYLLSLFSISARLSRRAVDFLTVGLICLIQN